MSEEAQQPQTEQSQAGSNQADSNIAPMDDAEIRQNLEGFGDVKLEISAILGMAYMPVEQFLKLGRGAIIELSRKKADDIDICANGYGFAKAEVVVVGEKIGVNLKSIGKNK